MPGRILIVDDETDLAELLGYNLTKAGFHTRIAPDGQAGLRAIAEFEPDLVVLDVMMPGLDGHQVLARIRTNPRTTNLPVILLTAKNQEADEFEGLSKGADDFLSKPFSIRILQTRIEKLIERSQETQASENLGVGPLQIDLDTHQASLDGSPLPLTLTEFRLLVSLLEAQGRVLGRSALIERAIGSGITITARTIDVHITAIRKKLGTLAPIVKTVRGVGYRIDRDEIAEESRRSTPASSE